MTLEVDESMIQWKADPISSLRSRFDQHVPEDEGFKNMENVFAVGQHAVQHAVVHGIMLRQPLPALKYVGWDVDILPQFLQRVPPKKEAVEERCFLLRFGELKLRSLHKLGIPLIILTRKISDAPVKFLPNALSGNTMINPLSSPPPMSMRVGGHRAAKGARKRGASHAQLQIPAHPARINTWT